MPGSHNKCLCFSYVRAWFSAVYVLQLSQRHHSLPWEIGALHVPFLQEPALGQGPGEEWGPTLTRAAAHSLLSEPNAPAKGPRKAVTAAVQGRRAAGSGREWQAAPGISHQPWGLNPKRERSRTS